MHGVVHDAVLVRVEPCDDRVVVWVGDRRKYGAQPFGAHTVVRQRGKYRGVAPIEVIRPVTVDRDQDQWRLAAGRGLGRGECPAPDRGQQGDGQKGRKGVKTPAHRVLHLLATSA